jgi:hypothetical protein
MAHGRNERALLLDSYFVDSALRIETPGRKLLHRYGEDGELPTVVHEVVSTLCGWT